MEIAIDKSICTATPNKLWRANKDGIKSCGGMCECCVQRKCIICYCKHRMRERAMTKPPIDMQIGCLWSIVVVYFVFSQFYNPNALHFLTARVCTTRIKVIKWKMKAKCVIYMPHIVFNGLKRCELNYHNHTDITDRDIHLHNWSAWARAHFSRSIFSLCDRHSDSLFCSRFSQWSFFRLFTT